MYIFLRLELDSSPDATWDALSRPDVFARVSQPLLVMRPAGRGGFPERWTEGHPFAIRYWLLGFLPLGSQIIDVSYTSRPGGVRMMIDGGRPATGLLTITRKWDHRMAVSATDDGRTLFRDRLNVSAGIFTVPMWLGMWVFWQWRASRLKKLAKRWG